MKGVSIIRDPKTAEKLIDPMRRTILMMLAGRHMTEHELAKSLGLTESAVGYHLKTLESAGLVKIMRREPENHGIIQKFYGSSAIIFVIDINHMPQDISRYFMPLNIERMRAILSTLPADQADPLKGDGTVELLAMRFVDFLISVGESLEGEANAGREELTIKLYHDAFQKMLKDGALRPPTKGQY